ncbi:hypothetical protein PV341_44735, partial [Streptomyces sp. PA03-1a]|nr:hypothetical protein [Streptomyces sp. PA03-1a]
MTTSIALWFEHLAGKHWHNDLRLHIGGHRHTCDSYYLTLESRHLGANLTRLLEQWIEQVNELRDAGGTAYLPYDFSDQCTAWLRVSSTDGDTAVVQAGWSLIEAWGIETSDYRATAPDITDGSAAGLGDRFGHAAWTAGGVMTVSNSTGVRRP